jgi:rhamnulokinase/L-fuculokinase
LLAVDLGASSGRVMLGSFTGERIALEELHRFPNEPVLLHGTLHWDVLRLLHEIKRGLCIAAERGEKIHGIGIDTWGVDFGLLDSCGRLLENPVHYRDARSCGMLEEAEKRISLDALYAATGIQLLEFNTAFQLLSVRLQRPELLARAARLLFLPDLLGYFLTGEKVTERSVASTSQLLDIHTGRFSQEILHALELPEHIFEQPTAPGACLGTLLPEIQKECGLPAVPVFSVCGHDTQSAITAVPSTACDFAFLSSGTWSLLGTELDAPLINAQTRQWNITNETGCGGKIGFLKNITGLWLVQECRRHWRAHPTDAQFTREANRTKDFGFAELERFAREAVPARAHIEPNDPFFTAPGDIPGRVRQYCGQTAQPIPETVEDVLRCVYESLALAYGKALQIIQRCTGKRYQTLHIIGGGSRDALLCQMAADTCGISVQAGPAEATVLGNLAVQLLAQGELADLAQIRALAAASGDGAIYAPRARR